MADFDLRPGDRPLKTHDSVALGAGAADTKTVRFLGKPAKQLSVYWNGAGSGSPKLQLYAVTSAGDIQLGSDQTAASGHLELPSGVVVHEIKITFTETGGTNGLTVDVEVHAAA